VLIIFREGKEILKFDSHGGSGPYHMHLGKKSKAIDLISSLPPVQEQLQIVSAELRSEKIISYLKNELNVENDYLLNIIEKIEKEIKKKILSQTRNSKNVTIHL
jgi:hypothetical protein